MLGTKAPETKALENEPLGALPPKVNAPLLGARGVALVETLAETESPAFTARRARRSEASGTSHDPIVWTEAVGCNVVDADGNRYVDLTAGFGAAAIGHRHPRVVAAVTQQSQRLLHALGDVHPSDVKIALLQALKQLAPFDDARVVLGLSGSDAVECALKTAALATKRYGVLAFDGAYHGLAHGPLAACGYREAFRTPFAPQLNPHVIFAPYPTQETSLDAALAAVARTWDASPTPIGAVLYEPLLGRGGVVAPVSGFARGLSLLAKERGALLIADEVFVGLGRCGETFVSVADGAMPDLLCIGKALGGGMPISACVGTFDSMRAWGDPNGEALHTGTFFGHPVSCAAALATLDVIRDEKIASQALRLQANVLPALQALVAKYPSVVADARGRGAMLGLKLKGNGSALRVVQRLLDAGYIALPAGPNADVVSFTPPITIPDALVAGFVTALDAALAELE